MNDIAKDILVGIVIAAVSSVITVQLSLSRFRSQKWWERKVAAYERVIEALHHAKAFSEANLNAEEEGRKLPEDRDQELRRHAREAHREIDRATDIGGFILSDDAHARLKQYRKEAAEAANESDWYSFLDADLTVTKACLSDLIKIAKKDLKTR